MKNDYYIIIDDNMKRIGVARKKRFEKHPEKYDQWQSFVVCCSIL